jgi:hypothetical protein
MPAMTCRNCNGDIEYEMERVDSGDGVWAQSGWVGFVLSEALEASRSVPEGDVGYRTSCGCVWDAGEIDVLHDTATERAGEWSGEP